MTTAGFNPNAGGTAGAGYITSSTPAPLVGPVAVGKERPTTSSKFETKTEGQLIADYGRKSTAERAKLAAKLKAAGFNVPVTGAYNQKVRDAFISASAALNDEINTLAKNDPTRLATVGYNLDSYLDGIAASGAGGTGGPTTYSQTSVTNATSAARTLDSIAAELLGRQLSSEEKAKYTAMLNAAEMKAPSVTKVTPGTGMQTSVTTGGLNEEQFLIEKLAATDEAKAQKVLNAYSAVSKMFGGLQ